MIIPEDSNFNCNSAFDCQLAPRSASRGCFPRGQPPSQPLSLPPERSASKAGKFAANAPPNGNYSVYFRYRERSRPPVTTFDNFPPHTAARSLLAPPFARFAFPRLSIAALPSTLLSPEISFSPQSVRFPFVGASALIFNAANVCSASTSTPSRILSDRTDC